MQFGSASLEDDGRYLNLFLAGIDASDAKAADLLTNHVHRTIGQDCPEPDDYSAGPPTDRVWGDDWVANLWQDNTGNFAGVQVSVRGESSSESARSRPADAALLASASGSGYTWFLTSAEVDRVRFQGLTAAANRSHKSGLGVAVFPTSSNGDVVRVDALAADGAVLEAAGVLQGLNGPDVPDVSASLPRLMAAAGGEVPLPVGFGLRTITRWELSSAFGGDAYPFLPVEAAERVNAWCAYVLDQDPLTSTESICRATTEITPNALLFEHDQFAFRDTSQVGMILVGEAIFSVRLTCDDEVHELPVARLSPGPGVVATLLCDNVGSLRVEGLNDAGVVVTTEDAS